MGTKTSEYDRRLRSNLSPHVEPLATTVAPSGNDGKYSGDDDDGMVEKGFYLLLACIYEIVLGLWGLFVSESNPAGFNVNPI